MPTEILALRGSDNQYRKRRKTQPKPDGTAPNPPEKLSKDARMCWDRLMPILREIGVLSSTDAMVIYRYCDAWSRWRRLQKEMDMDERAGRPIDDRHVRMYRTLGDMMRAIETEFGLTPSARARLALGDGASGSEPDSPMLRLIREVQ